MKTYVLTVSTKFQTKHKRAGDYTGFVDKILSGEKIHTIRENLEYWKKILYLVNKGEAELSIRVWNGIPYYSTQTEITRLRGFTVGWQSIAIGEGYINIDHNNKKGKDAASLRSELAKHDGLSLEDFNEWFKKPKTEGIIIHFTQYRYL